MRRTDLRFLAFLVLWVVVCGMGAALLARKSLTVMLVALPIFGVLSAVLYTLAVDGRSTLVRALRSFGGRARG